MPTIPSLVDMLKAGVHFGHRTSRWHPKMKSYIHGERGGVHVIDLEQTRTQLEKALNYIEEVVARGGTVMMIGTKKQVQPVVEKHAGAAKVPYVTNRWLGGTLTNFTEIKRLIKTYLDLKDKREKGELKKYTKLEQLQFDRKIEELDEKIGGISTMTKLPDAVIVLDVRHDKTALQEASKRGITVVAVCDTNVNPDAVDYVVPANDDSIGSITMMTKLFCEAAKVGGARAKTAPAAGRQQKGGSKVAAKADDKEAVQDLDDAMKDKLAKEKEEGRK